MPTARDLADHVLEARRTAWAKDDPSTAIVATEQLGPEDDGAVRRIVHEAGYEGEELERMTHQVKALVIGRVQALADNLPATGSD